MLIRNSTFRKSFSLFLILVFLINISAPTVSFALTNGPHQPEFTEYEEPGSTDMVNLLTGDFSYSLPLLEVPGPEGGFSLPLSYHAGIGLEQESSWVGLGFSMNAGAINRNIVGFPDDAKGEHFEIHRQDPQVQRGWRSSLGPFGNIGWNSNTGHHGTVSLLDIVSVSYDNGGVMNDVSVFGVHGNRNGVNVQPAQTMNAISTVVSLGGSGAATGSQAAAKAFQESAKQLAISSAISTAISVGVSAFGGNGSGVTSLGYFPLSYKKKGFNYRYWIDATRTEWMYGTLNLGNMPVLSDASHDQEDIFANPRIKNESGTYVTAPTYSDLTNDDEGPASDMHMPWDGQSYYNKDFLGATSLAKDNFSVLGPGVSGILEPYRHDVGTLAFPRNAVDGHQKIALKRFEDYKVGFKYQGDFSNSYVHHAGKLKLDTVPNLTKPLFGMHHTLEEFDNSHFDKLLFDFDDKVLTQQRTEPNREGLQSNRLIHGRNVEWFTNREISTDSANLIGSLFMDFLPASQRQAFRDNLPAHGIGGYSITRDDGLTYHYALPVYSKDSYTKIMQVSDASKFSEMEMDAPFAHTWLLTAITGADFVDLPNENQGIVDDGDLGYWVKLEYGKFSDNYQYRMPYDKNAFLLDYEKTSKSYTSGERENYYLNFIKTRSHTAMFVKGVRKDGRGSYSYVQNTLQRAPSSSLYLDEIILMRNEEFKQLNGGNSLLQPSTEAAQHLISSGPGDPDSGDSFDGILDISMTLALVVARILLPTFNKRRCAELNLITVMICADRLPTPSILQSLLLKLENPINTEENSH
jgi:hypothetical protein